MRSRSLASSTARIESGRVAAYRIPTPAPEADATATWEATVLVTVELEAGGARGLGYTYASAGVARLIDDEILPVVRGQDAMNVPACVASVRRALRNLGVGGVSARAISAADVALWDLKARLLGLPLVTLLGAARERVEVYGSGGFVSQRERALQQQLRGWAEAGLRQVKMKVGGPGQDDLRRVRAARAALGQEVGLYVDANGAWTPKEALARAEDFHALEVRWLEEPVSSDDLAGLRLVRERGPAGMEVAAGEYGFDRFYFEAMLSAGAVDVLQADATRCGGVTGFVEAATLCEARGVPLSSHTAPSLHLHLCLAAPAARRPLEYFADHVRIERELFDGFQAPDHGLLSADRTRPGLGLSFKRQDAERYRA